MSRRRGQTRPSRARYTFLRGQAIYDDGTLAVREGFGRQAVAATKVGARG